jgi:hypothetical protein
MATHLRGTMPRQPRSPHVHWHNENAVMSTTQRMVWALVAIITFAFAPVLSVMTAAGIASAYDCQLNEGTTNPCLVAGMDLGDLLGNMFIAGWLGLATVPFGAIALLIWIGTAVVLYLRRHKPTY